MPPYSCAVGSFCVMTADLNNYNRGDMAHESTIFTNWSNNSVNL